MALKIFLWKDSDYLSYEKAWKCFDDTCTIVENRWKSEEAARRSGRQLYKPYETKYLYENEMKAIIQRCNFYLEVHVKVEMKFLGLCV